MHAIYLLFKFNIDLISVLPVEKQNSSETPLERIIHNQVSVCTLYMFTFCGSPIPSPYIQKNSCIFF